MMVQNKLKNSIKPFESQKAFSRYFALHPLHVGIFVFSVIMQATGLIHDEYRELGHWTNVGISALRHSAYIGFVYFLQPHFLRFCAVRGWPFVACLTCHYWAFILLYFALFGYIASQYTHVPTYLRLFNNIFIGLPMIVAIAGLLGRDAALALFDDPQRFPTWLPYKDSKSDPDGLSEKTKKTIRYMQSQPPYTDIITAEGRQLVKSSLTELEKTIPADLGWRVHRSYWVARSECVSVNYVNGNPQLTLRDGQTLPINRKSVKIIQNYLTLKDMEDSQRDVRAV